MGVNLKKMKKSMKKLLAEGLAHATEDFSHVSIDQAADKAFGKANTDMVRRLLHESAIKAVKLLSATDGYFLNELVKIRTPEKLHSLESLAKKLHLSAKFDEFVLSMNRAAEHAANASLPILERFVGGLTVDNLAHMITDKGSPAADLFKQKSEVELREAYLPIVQRSMSEYSVSRHLKELLSHKKKAKLERILLIRSTQLLVPSCNHIIIRCIMH